MLSDGVSQIFLDFSLHGEEGKNKQKVQGLTAKQRKARFTENHEGQAVTKHGNMNARQIIKHLQREKACKHNKTLRCTYCTMDGMVDGVPVRLFFCK